MFELTKKFVICFDCTVVQVGIAKIFFTVEAKQFHLRSGGWS